MWIIYDQKLDSLCWCKECSKALELAVEVYTLEVITMEMINIRFA